MFCAVVAWLLFLLMPFCCREVSGKTKCAQAIGVLDCPSDPKKAADVEVYLMDDDGFLNPDDTMGWTTSNEKGEFTVQGCGYDLWSLPEPYLKILHFCGSSSEKVLKTPAKYIFRPHTIDYGIISLEGN
ncbi:unnamed protein product [Soboliphyme baturini]|uniref:Transthyretin-like family protein n=1 Tax=Soboliphyme baturini TaxID=241478 RepID=A0A183JA66_9BILA|nr:unnamed protein product [Soboliphyme baturini]